MKQCRFCLEDTVTPKNPLIEPCVCRGSVQFVHLLCLRRWALLEPDENASTCSICKQPFQINVLPRYEIVPPWSLSQLVLSRTTLIGLALHYSTILFTSNFSTPTIPSIMDQIKTIQYIFHYVWLWGIVQNCRVANPVLYREKMIRSLLPFILAGHIYIFIRLFYFNDTIYCFSINVVMNLYWKEHLRLIGLVNQELTAGV